MDLDASRRAIRPLLDESKPADALASYYAYYHPDPKTGLVIYPSDAVTARGYIAFSRTGIDLFRPLLTMRLPLEDEAAAELIQSALPVDTPAILITPENYIPILNALFDVQTESRLQVLVLDRGRFQHVINVLVTQEKTPDGLPRFVIRSRQENDQVVASASINWQTPNFAEISVFTERDQRRQGWGRSVVAALCQHILDGGRTPLYTVEESNRPSLKLAEGIGFVDLGIRQHLLQATRKSLL
ncbi:MAG: GNAT family N-acetyltransferase [Candidatus Promineifilaceae bacterium]|jgi:L-amino acid N-acyltransferase YncA